MSASARPLSLAESIWNFTWTRVLPAELTDGVTFELSSYEETARFARDHFQEIFQQNLHDPRFNWHESSDHKSRYYQAAGDFFSYKALLPNGERKIVGIFVGTPVDWSSYYIRNTSILPEYQGRHLVHRTFPLLFDWLGRHGIDRIEADVSPSNLAGIQLLTRFRFNIRGYELSERWGGLLHFTRFLNPACEQKFIEQFCSGVPYQLNDARGGSPRQATNKVHPTYSERSAP